MISSFTEVIELFLSFYIKCLLELDLNKAKDWHYIYH